MKFHLISDCHLNFADLVLPGGDILVMAGDIVEAGHLRIADNAKKDVDLADRYRRFFREELAKYNHVVYVKGNHEHYHNSYDDTHARLLKEMPFNTHLLENETVEIDDTIIFGATLWTDCHRSNPLTMNLLQGRMYDYRGIHHSGGIRVKLAYGGEYFTHKFTPQYTVNLHKESLSALDAVCRANPDRKIVVVTHHAPTAWSIDERFVDDHHMNGGYYSGLADFILERPNIKVWVHGHVHEKKDYMVGNTRVVSNPRGYAGYEVPDGQYDTSFTVEVA